MGNVDNRIFVRRIYVLFIHLTHRLYTENVDNNVVNLEFDGDNPPISWVYYKRMLTRAVNYYLIGEDIKYE